MIFRNTKGELIDINIYNCKNDKIFYTKIMDLNKSSTKSICNATKPTTHSHNFSNSVILETIK
jgi:hypothetical protein